MTARAFLQAWVAPRVGTLSALAIAGGVLIALIRTPNLPISSMAVPLAFVGAVVVFALLSLFDGRSATVARPAKAMLVCAALIAYAVLLYLDVRYWLAITLLMAVCFVVIGRRSWLVMLAVWAGTQLLAYGIFGAVLGIPIH